MPEYDIPLINLTRLQEYIEKMNRRAEKLGVPPITFQVGVPAVRRIEEQVRGRAPDGTDEVWIETRFEDYVTVIVDGITPYIEGWEFIAKIENAGVVKDGSSESREWTVDRHGRPISWHTPGSGTIIKTAPGARWELPEQFRSVTTRRCDHCRTERMRLAVYVIRNASTGEWKVVGGDCLKDFLKSRRDPEDIAKFYEKVDDDLFEFNRSPMPGGGWGYRPDLLIPTDGFIRSAANIIALEGWIGRKQYEEQDGSRGFRERTYQAVIERYYPPNPRKPLETSYWHRAMTRMTPDAQQRADEMFNSVMAYREILLATPDSELDDFGYNLKVIMSGHYIAMKNAAIAAAIFPSFWRYQKIHKPHEERGEWVGEEGARVDIVVKLDHTMQKETDYGLMTIYMLQDPFGPHRLVWFTNKEGEFKEGPTYRIRATVKRHDEYRGQRSTVITRVKVLEEIPQ